MSEGLFYVWNKSHAVGEKLALTGVMLLIINSGLAHRP